MKIPKIFLLFLILIMCSLCKKKSEEVAPEVKPVPIPDTVRAYHKLDPATKHYYNFSDESYWIYSNFEGKKLDSLHMSNFSFHIDTVTTNNNGTINIDVYETVTYTLAGVNALQTYKPELYVMARAAFVGVYSSRANRWLATYPFRFDTGGTHCVTTEYTTTQTMCKKFYSSLPMGNGKTYSNSTLFLRYIQGQGHAQGTHMPPNPAQTKCAWSPGFGIVQFESPPYDTTNYQLLRSNISPRQ